MEDYNVDKIIEKIDELIDELKIINQIMILVETYLSDKIFLPVSNNSIKDEEV